MDILRRAPQHLGSVAVRIGDLAASYGAVLSLAEALQQRLSSCLPAAAGSSGGARDGPRVAVYAEPGVPYVASTWATWLAGGVAVPLAVSHPPPELQYVLQDAGVSALLCPASCVDKLKDVAAAQRVTLLPVDDAEVLAAVAAAPVAPHGQQQQQQQQVEEEEGGARGAAARLQRGERSGGWVRPDDAGALIIYTSGTTGRPKGALHTQGSVGAQVSCLVDAWRWGPDDAILHALPLHHIHGIVNAMHCAHYCGAAVHFLPRFSPAAVWRHIVAGDVNVLMGVPTMYTYLLNHWEGHMAPQEREAAAAAAAALRLTVSGSAACPVVLLERWRALSGQTLLERYGMTETGMILSNPYEGERRAGYVGLPLPGVKVRVKPIGGASPGDADANAAAAAPAAAPAAAAAAAPADTAAPGAAGAAGEVGQLQVSGPFLFREYWGRPEATAAAFEDGYFDTGDIVELAGSPRYYRIMGRASADIIKHKGFKISGLDVEGVLLEHPAVAEAAVLGLADDVVGENVAALVVLKEQQQQQQQQGASAEASSPQGHHPHHHHQQQQELQQELTEWCRSRLAVYQVPRVWLLRSEPLPRNAMGKVSKKQLVGLFQQGGE